MSCTPTARSARSACPGSTTSAASPATIRGNLYATTRNPDGIIEVDVNGHVVFADSANNLIRAYVPSSTTPLTGHVINDLGGLITNDVPQGGDNGDGRYANQTKFSQPAGVAVTTGALLVVADTGNRAVRQIGPYRRPRVAYEAGRPVYLWRLSCTDTTRRRRHLTAHCAQPHIDRRSQIPGLRAAHIRIVRHGTVYATGRRGRHHARHFGLVIKQQRPLRPGHYTVVMRFGRHGEADLIALTIG